MRAMVLVLIAACSQQQEPTGSLERQLDRCGSPPAPPSLTPHQLGEEVTISQTDWIKVSNYVGLVRQWEDCIVFLR